MILLVGTSTNQLFASPLESKMDCILTLRLWPAQAEDKARDIWMRTPTTYHLDWEPYILPTSLGGL